MVATNDSHQSKTPVQRRKEPATTASSHTSDLVREANASRGSGRVIEITRKIVNSPAGVRGRRDGLPRNDPDDSCIEPAKSWEVLGNALGIRMHRSEWQCLPETSQ